LVGMPWSRILFHPNKSSVNRQRVRFEEYTETF
jgi:hypothetical protein